MNGLLIAVLVMASGGAPPPLAAPDWTRLDGMATGASLSGALHPEALRASGAIEAQGPPVCVGEVCQPRVSVPGFEPRFDSRGRRTDLLASTLERMDAGFVARFARSMATSGVRLDYRPPQVERAVPGRPNNGRLEVLVRWRLDAWHGPVWAPARSPYP
jgi:hypothetical protein